MATRQRVPAAQVISPMENGEQEQFEHEDDYLTEDMALANVLADLGGASDAMVKVYRKGAGGYRDLTFLTECPPEEYSPMRIQEDFGGGTYRVHVKVAGQMVANKELKIGAPLQRSAPPQVDLMAPIQSQMNAMADSIKLLVETMRQAQQAAPQSRTDMLNEMVVMKELLGNAPAAKVVDPMESLERILAVHSRLGELTGGGGAEKVSDKSIVMEAIKSFGPPLMAAIAQKAAMAPGQAAMLPAPGHVESGPAVPATQEQMENEKMKAMFTYYLGLLVEKAKADSDPALYADLIMDNLDANTLGELLGPPAWFDNLCALNANIGQYREWFAELRDLVVKGLTEEGATGDSAGLSATLSPEKPHAPGGPANTDPAQSS